MEFSQPTLSLSGPESQSSLDCEENESVLQEEDENEFVQILISREIINGDGIQKQEFDDWIKDARLDAIHYIFRTGLTFGFKVQTVYLAVTYMDRFLSRKLIEAANYWVVPLSAISCLSLAAKMEECKVPGLSALRERNYRFESKVIQRMEFLVLDTLEWKMKLITPFRFIRFFVTTFCQNASNHLLLSKVSELILKAIKSEMTIQQYRPSTIAAAATLLTLDQTLTEESFQHKINTLSNTNCLDIEEIFVLYNILKQQVWMNCGLLGGDKIENAGKSPYESGSKRKSLTFTESNQSSHEKDDNKRQC